MIITGILVLLRKKQAQEETNISTTGPLHNSSNIQAGGNVSIHLSPAGQISNNLNIPTGQHVVTGSDTGEDIIKIKVHGVHTGNNCDITASSSESILMLIEKARVGLNLGYEAKIEGSAFPFVLRWVLVDEKAVNYWKSLSINKKQKTYALIRPMNKLLYCTSELQSLKDLGVYDGMVARLFPIQDTDSPSQDKAMLASPH